MSSYFDAMNRAVSEAAEHEPDDAEFLRSVWGIEHQLYREVTYITGDREFPDDLRERMLGVLAVRSVYCPGRVVASKAARDRVLRTRSSVAIEDLHSLFHELASRRIETRFGMLSDSPTHMAALRDDHDKGS